MTDSDSDWRSRYFSHDDLNECRAWLRRNGFVASIKDGWIRRRDSKLGAIQYTGKPDGVWCAYMCRD
jgi:hypothetical protein